MLPVVRARRASRLLALLALMGLAACESPPGGAPPADVSLTVRGVKDGALLTGVVTIGAEVLDSRLEAMEVYVGDRRVARAMAAPFQVALDTRLFADARVRVSVVGLVDATDVTRSFDVTIDNTPPRVAVPALASGVVYASGDAVTFPVDVSDASGVRELTVTFNGVPAVVSSAPPYVATLPLAALGLTSARLPMPLAVTVRAVDVAGVAGAWNGPVTLRSRVAWQASTLGEVWAPPVFGATGVAYFGSRDGKLYGVSPTGTPVGAPIAIGKEILFSPAVDVTGGVDRLWVSAGDSVVRVDPTKGQIAATFTAPSTLGTAPVLGPDGVFVGTFGGELVALDRESLTKRWSSTTSAPIESTPALLAGGSVVFGSDDRFVHAVDATGAERWRLETGGPVWSRPIAARSGGVLIGSHDGYLYRVGAAGEKLWEFDTRGQVWGGAAETATGDIYVGSTFGELVALSATGQARWHKDVGGLAFATPVVASSGTVFVAGASGTVYAFSPGGDIKWTHALGAAVLGGVSLSKDESRLLVGTKARTVVALYSGETP